MNNRGMKIRMHVDNIQILGDYVVDGRILVLDLKGHGKANITAGKTEYFRTTCT